MRNQKNINGVQVNTATFQLSHGRSPRGTGGWYFFTDAGQELDTPHVVIFGGYLEARQQATRWAKENGHDTLFVGS